jgi:hypothetical protein
VLRRTTSECEAISWGCSDKSGDRAVLDDRDPRKRMDARQVVNLCFMRGAPMDS